MLDHTKKLLTIFAIAIIAFILEFGFHQARAAQILIFITGIVMAVLMLLEMIKTLKSGSYGVDLLALTAILATLCVGQYWASMVILIMLVGGDTLEDYAAKKANTELKSLLERTPTKAHLLLKDGQIKNCEADTLNIGDEVVVKPGEVVPTDGIVLDGTSLVDQASLTGESMPMEKQPGDSIMSGVVNGDEKLVIKVTKRAYDSQYQQLVRLVQQAEKTPAHFVRMADRYAVPFTIIAYLIAGFAWYMAKTPLRFAEVLVVASPCPLILAAPVALISGMSRASRNGIIVKTGTIFEKLARTKTAAFDKTGTLTTGILTVDQIVLLNHDYTENKFLQLVASAEQASNHILARSLLQDAAKKHLPLMKIDQLSEVSGSGVIARLDKHEIKIGRLPFVAPDEQNIIIKNTNVFVAIDGKLVGYITFIDHVRPEAKQTIIDLKDANIDNIIMVTGDQEQIAQKIGQEVGITKVYADLLPMQKIDILKHIPTNKRPVMMVGDGINDAPSLAAADIGIAMGATGSSAASESADIVIVKDDLLKVPQAVLISKQTLKIAKQAVLIGIFICIVLMIIAATGVIPALIGALLQELVDTVSILWALKAHTNKQTT